MTIKYFFFGHIYQFHSMDDYEKAIELRELYDNSYDFQDALDELDIDYYAYGD